MRQLVIHVGLPKTATTSLQKALSKNSNYLGAEGDYAIYTEELLSIFSDFSRGREITKSLISWWGGVKDYIDGKGFSSAVVLSSEYFFSGEINKFQEFPFLRKSHSLGKPCLVEFIGFLSSLLRGEVVVKVFLTIRNQALWLASKYAQASPRIYNASQSDFEMRVKKFSHLASKQWCDWSCIVKEFDSVLGEENFLVLCMEDIGEDCFWSNFYDFCLMRQDEYAIPFISNSINVKRVSDNKWALRRFRPGAFFCSFWGLFPGSLPYRIAIKLDNFLVKLRLLNPGFREETI